MPRALLRRRAVGLVEGRFVDEADAGARRDFLQRLRHLQRMRAALQRAGPGDQRERQRVAELHVADGDDGVRNKVFIQARIPLPGRP